MNPKLLDRAVQLAYNGIHLTDYRYKHFSFLVEKNRIVAWGWNFRHKTHPIAKTRFNSIHSELHAIIRSNLRTSELKGMEMINIRIAKVGLSLSKPCEHCQAMLRGFGIEVVHFSTKQGWETMKL